MEHPLIPFLPSNARILILGSFPPKLEKWGMNFYYPNFQNDFWRIMGLVFFEHKDYFLNLDQKSFNLEKIKVFLTNKGIAMGDSAQKIERLRDNASDKFLNVLETLDFENVLKQIPHCTHIIATGTKSYEIISEYFGGKIVIDGRKIILHKAPSSSRAYPMALAKKAEIYKIIFDQIFNYVCD